MSRKRTNQSSDRGSSSIAILVAVIGLAGTLVMAYFSFRGNMEPTAMIISATQTAEAKALHAPTSAADALIVQLVPAAARCLIVQIEPGMSVDYDPAGNIIRTTSERGAQGLYTYDGAGNRVQIRDPNGNLTRCEYDWLNRLAAVTDPLGHTTSFQYDGLGRISLMIDSRGNEIEYSYGEDGTPTPVVR